MLFVCFLKLVYVCLFVFCVLSVLFRIGRGGGIFFFILKSDVIMNYVVFDYVSFFLGVEFFLVRWVIKVIIVISWNKDFYFFL